MPERTAETDRLDYVVGEVQALLAFALVCAETHPDRELLKLHLSASSQVGLAKIEATLASDKVVEGYQKIVGELHRLLDRPAL